MDESLALRAEGGKGEKDGSDAGMDELLKQFDAALQELQNDPSLDRETREALKEQFNSALHDAVGGEVPLASLSDRSMWMDAIQALQASGDIPEGEVNDLIRQVNQALQPLQRRESQLAIEFSRRLKTDGEEKALAWFRQERARTSGEPVEAHVSPAPADGAPPQLRSDAINARAHRLRGPPRKR